MLRSLKKNYISFSPSEKIGILFTFFSLAFFFVSSSLIYRSVRLENSSAAKSRNARAIIDVVTDLKLTLLDVETSHRGFIISQNKSFLVPIDGQKDKIAELISTAREIVGLPPKPIDLDYKPNFTVPLDTPFDFTRWSDTQKLEELAEVVWAKINFAQEVLSTNDIKGSAEAASLIINLTGKALMDRARVLMAALIDSNTALLELHRDARNRANDSTLVISMVSGVLALGLIVVAGTMTVHLAQRKISAEREGIRAKNAEAVLQATGKQFEAMTSVIPQVIWTANPSGTITFLNKEVFSDGVSDHSDPNWMNLLDPSEQSSIESLWRNAVALKIPLESEVELYNPKSGVGRWYLVKAEPLWSTENDRNTLKPILKWFGTLTDIDNQIRLLDERNQLLASEREARSNAELAVRLKDEFVATLSHELRTPLNAMLGWIQICKSRPDDVDTWYNALDVLDRNVKLQSKLISDLLDTHRMMVGKIEYENKPIEISSLLRGMCEDLIPQAKAKGLTIEFKSEIKTGCYVLGDEERLKQVFTNLILNSMKFTDSGDLIVVEMSRTSRGIEIDVRDDGVGMSPDFLKVAFEKYRQEHTTTNRSFGGLGLGLTVAKGIVDAHGGMIAAKSDGLGKGSTFTVILPPFVTQSRITGIYNKIADDEGFSLRGSAKVVADRLQGRAIVAIDDQVDSRVMLQELLAELDLNVELADSGHGGIELARKLSPALVLCDIGMPIMDGYGVAKAFRTDSELKNTLLVAVTAHSRPSDIQAALDAGFNAHISKPVDFDSLIGTLAEILQTIPTPNYEVM